MAKRKRRQSTAGQHRSTSGWWSIRLGAPFWAAVSTLLLLYGLIAVEPGDPKGRAILIALGAFGLLCSLPIVVRHLIRSRRDRP